MPFSKRPQLKLYVRREALETQWSRQSWSVLGNPYYFIFLSSLGSSPHAYLWRGEAKEWFGKLNWTQLTRFYSTVGILPEEIWALKPQLGISMLSRNNDSFNQFPPFPLSDSPTSTLQRYLSKRVLRGHSMWDHLNLPSKWHIKDIVTNKLFKNFFGVCMHALLSW